MEDDPGSPDPQPGTSTGSATRVATGGNPDAFFQSTHNIVYGDIIYTGGIKEDFSYDPGLEGGFASLSITADLSHPNSGGTAWQLVVEQGGIRYYSYPLFGFFQGDWRTVTALDLTAAKFDTNPLAGFGGLSPDGVAPDFSAAGSEIMIGFAFANARTGPGSDTNIVGLDNYRVSFNSVPEPSSLALIGLGCLCMAVLDRRRRIARGSSHA